MLKYENIVKPSADQWEFVIRGMRNPLNSWSRSDSYILNNGSGEFFILGKTDHQLAFQLSRAGSDHGKYLRMLPVMVDVIAPFYWWKQFDSYKIGTVANSTSTMHRISQSELDLEDFSLENLSDGEIQEVIIPTIERINSIIRLIHSEKNTLEGKEIKNLELKIYQLLPDSYNQRRSVLLNYEVLKNMYGSRRNHKLPEWRKFLTLINRLEHPELITL